ncbi:hypothetical protein scyTo_0000167 [Scyliorhinus torazame]|uniref:Uncharacterized protein n=1 Tax=Scyliorhinus torazame TaxID=75743 RepID=A0A401NRS0_SCYTO|nr:hypothetical protein [Scyliorhinus torazame]
MYVTMCFARNILILGSSVGLSDFEMNTSKALTKHSDPNQQPPTPSLTKRKQAQEKKLFRSPTDSMLSPCSQRLMKPKQVNHTELQSNKITAQQVHEFSFGDKENDFSNLEQRLSFGRSTST